MENRKTEVLIAGAGISGIRTALDLAETGHRVTMIDKAPHMGGVISRLDHQFPTDRCGMCKMLPLLDRDAASRECLRKGLFHKNLEILLHTEIISIEGEPGAFRVKLMEKDGWVDPGLCMGCGICEQVCPVSVPDAFNQGLSERRAIYLPSPHTAGNPYMVDTVHCTRCGECVSVCPANAIRIGDDQRKDFRILVVDDELIVRDSIREWLSGEAGYTTDMAESGHKALEMAEKDTYHLALIDIKMPGMDGVETLKGLKEIQPDMEVLMITAYATVETAVEAMKLGARDYLMKPFDPDDLISRAGEVYTESLTPVQTEIEAGAIVLSCGVDFYTPREGKNPFGYGVYPDVVTGLEFERMISGTGPANGRPMRLSDGKPVQRIAWIQCVGSRDLQNNADFCSNVCCMYAIKEASLAKNKLGHDVETVIFYMDMRTFGKSYERYLGNAEDLGVKMVRTRVHSLCPEKTGEGENRLKLASVRMSGEWVEDLFDLVVLPVGMRPAKDIGPVMELEGVETNSWGFPLSLEFKPSETGNPGVFLSGSVSGLKDIRDSVIHAGSAALSVSGFLRTSPMQTPEEEGPETGKTLPMRDVSMEMPKIQVFLCTCSNALAPYPEMIRSHPGIRFDPAVMDIRETDALCRDEGIRMAEKAILEKSPNRVIIAGCRPMICKQASVKLLARLQNATGLSSGLMEMVDIRTSALPEIGEEGKPKNPDTRAAGMEMIRILSTAIAGMKRVNPLPAESTPVFSGALVIGGGISGMTAALCLADHGHPVSLVEKTGFLGGNLNWIRNTLEGQDTRTFLEETRDAVQRHPNITIHMETRVSAAVGEAGRFFTSLQDTQGKVTSIQHGILILATGGKEARTTLYGHGKFPKVFTQKEFALGVEKGDIQPKHLVSVVMIQCVGQREEPRNFCSRICCMTTLKNALFLKENNPDINVFVLYKDMMAYGFAEAYYTKAREKGVIFIQYSSKNRPGVSRDGQTLHVDAFEPVLGKPVIIEADMVVLATGIQSRIPGFVTDSLGCGVDSFGFFLEADDKWRPLDSMKEGVFSCGLCLAPSSITEAVASAKGAAMRGLRILERKTLPGSRITASVHTSLCALCEKCIETCPCHARILDPEREMVVVNPALCQGCGACASVCPNFASFLEGFLPDQVMDMIDAALL